MDDSDAASMEQMQAFLAGSAPVQFTGQGRKEVYAWAEKTLVRHEYASLGKAGKGLARQYLAQMTGLRRAGDAADHLLQHDGAGETGGGSAAHGRPGPAFLFGRFGPSPQAGRRSAQPRGAEVA